MKINRNKPKKKNTMKEKKRKNKLKKTTKQITWNFIIERAPWWRGFWERLVRSIKKPLKKILGQSTFSSDELQTILVQIEAVITAKSLTYVYDDEESISYPLTPSDLMYRRRITATPNMSPLRSHQYNSVTHELSH